MQSGNNLSIPAGEGFHLLEALLATAKMSILSQAARALKWWQPETSPPEPLARQAVSNGQVGKYPRAPTIQTHLIPLQSCAHDAMLYVHI